MDRYLVFARTAYAEPLEHRGDLEANDREEAEKLAVEQYGRDWIELALVPAAPIRWVLQVGGDRPEGGLDEQ